MKFLLLLLLFSLVSTAQIKINGLSFVASNNPISLSEIQPVLNINANWVALMPFGFMKTVGDTNLIFNSKQQWWGETKNGIIKTALAFHNKNCKILLKPQIWIANDGFTGAIQMKSERDWITFEHNYEIFILEYAQLAADNKIEMFCIGTELNNFILLRVAFWKQLITKIKYIYKGQITYAENWDTYQKVPFIAALDYIGIDAYFPLSKEKSPEYKSLLRAWKPIKSHIKKLSLKYNKPVLFTEFGYQSKNFSTDQPWNHASKESINLIIQANGIAAVFSQFWREKWFAGGFLWKWYDNDNFAGGIFDTDFTVQNKPAEIIIRNQYKLNKKAQ